VLKNPANNSKAVSLTEEQSRYAFGHGISEDESKALYDRWTIPAPGKPLFQAATANLKPHSETKANRMDQLEQVLRLVDVALGSNALGIYLHGSAVRGGLKPASDLDILVVSQRSLDQRERQTLVDGLLPISGPRVGARSAELIVVVQTGVRPWQYPPTCDFLYGDWLREEIDANGPPQPEPMPNLALMIAMTLDGDHPLVGPPPAQVLDPVPRADLVRGSLDGIPNLLHDLDDDTRNVVLTLARVWTTVATGEIKSKDAAADWALARLQPEHRPVLEHAKQLYLTRRYSEEAWSDKLRAQVRQHVDAVLAEIAKLTAFP
jgi:predicted nucleotidyltransferase